MQETSSAAPSGIDAVRAGSLRRRILEYIADQGGELRCDSGCGLRRQISDALEELPARVSQALIALEKAGLLEREMDLRQHRCHAIRLVPRPLVPRPMPQRHQPVGSGWAGPLGRPGEGRARRQAELEAAQQELNDAIRRAAEASRRVERLRWALLRTADDRVPTG